MQSNGSTTTSHWNEFNNSKLRYTINCHNKVMRNLSKYYNNLVWYGCEGYDSVLHLFLPTVTYLYYRNTL